MSICSRLRLGRMMRPRRSHQSGLDDLAEQVGVVATEVTLPTHLHETTPQTGDHLVVELHLQLGVRDTLGEGDTSQRTHAAIVIDAVLLHEELDADLGLLQLREGAVTENGAVLQQLDDHVIDHQPRRLCGCTHTILLSDLLVLR